MAIKVGKKNLQTNKYNYTWTRDYGDGEYSGIKDQAHVDKDEGYEVCTFIQNLMNKHNLSHQNDVTSIEDALHAPKLSSVVMRTLTRNIFRLFKLG